MSQCYIEDIEFLQSIVDDQRMEYPTNQTDLLFLDLSGGDDCREYPLVYPVKKIPIQKKVNSLEFELFCTKTQTPEKIRESFNNASLYPEGITLGRALERGAEAVRKYYNDKNLRKRSKKC